MLCYYIPNYAAYICQCYRPVLHYRALLSAYKYVNKLILLETWRWHHKKILRNRLASLIHSSYSFSGRRNVLATHAIRIIKRAAFLIPFVVRYFKTSRQRINALHLIDNINIYILNYFYRFFLFLRVRIFTNNIHKPLWILVWLWYKYSLCI